MPDVDYMEKQTELDWNKRRDLIEWIVQVHLEFKMLPETLHLAVNLLDRFLSQKAISFARYLLAGAVALTLAGKFEEVRTPCVRTITIKCGGAFKLHEFLRAERYFLDVLNFDLSWPGPMNFLRKTSAVDGYAPRLRNMAKFFLDIMLFWPNFLTFPASIQAAAAHCLALNICDHDWVILSFLCVVLKLLL